MSKAALSPRSFTRNTSGKAWVGRVVNYLLQMDYHKKLFVKILYDSQ